ncbi:histidinol-phosphate transaminase [Geodermatophilus sp. CPCC 205761]|uniref:histidinol-phosphate transaminase n=1 Tax=Geodermatophilus sp. CPCC 205761 TaxID=2936597 RepID=UPI003EED0A2E
MSELARTTTDAPAAPRAGRAGPRSLRSADALSTAPDPMSSVPDLMRAQLAGDVSALTARFPAHRSFANENPYPPLAGVCQAIVDGASEINRYPDPRAGALRSALAARLAVPADDIVCGAGSAALLAQLLAVSCGPGDEVVYAWRSFEAYSALADLSGATSIRIPLTADARHDLPRMAGAVTDRTRLVVLCNPNNPTGACIEHDELHRFLSEVPGDVPVLIDEAYREFVRAPDVPDGLEFYRRHRNVAVLRTFSKAYGLAGLRVGYAIAHGPLTTALRAAVPPFAVSGLGQAAALASLDVTRDLDRRVDQVIAERDRVRVALLRQGWPVPESHANFLWVAAGARSNDLADACAAAGVFVLPFPGEGIRVTVGLPAANDAFLAVAAAYARRTAGRPPSPAAP